MTTYIKSLATFDGAVRLSMTAVGLYLVIAGESTIAIGIGAMMFLAGFAGLLLLQTPMDHDKPVYLTPDPDLVRRVERYKSDYRMRMLQATGPKVKLPPEWEDAMKATPMKLDPTFLEAARTNRREL